MNIVDRALIFATTAHCNIEQTRKYSGEPYIVHPIEVMMLVREHGGNETMQAAALLHDVVEDTRMTLNDITFRFGVEIGTLVDELTEPAHVGNRAQRKAIECARLSKISAKAQVIKLADLISNSRSIVTRDPNFAAVYLREKVAILTVMTNDDHPASRALRSMAWDIIPLEYRP